MTRVEKSHVSLEQHICPICGVTHNVGVLIDTRLRDSLERETITGYGHCEKCKKHLDDGRIAMVVVDPSQSTVPPTDGVTPGVMQMNEAHRTGEVAWIRRSAWEKVFSIPIPTEDMVFIPLEVRDILRHLGEDADER